MFLILLRKRVLLWVSLSLLCCVCILVVMFFLMLNSLFLSSDFGSVL